MTRRALKDVLRTPMHGWVDRALSEVQAQAIADRHNGRPRYLLTEVGDLELAIPRTRTLWLAKSNSSPEMPFDDSVGVFSWGWYRRMPEVTMV